MAAIYMWPPKPGTTILLTTHLYQVFAAEKLTFSTSLSGGVMGPLPGEPVQGSALMQSGYYEQHRWFYEDGPYDDEVQGSALMMSGYYESKLVEADSPDEMLQLTCVINDTCSMTGI